MFSAFYNLSLALIALFALPKLLWHYCMLGKYRGCLKMRLGLSLPPFSPKKGQQVIWIHSVSLGETRAVIPLYRKIRQANPTAAIVLSTTTETGQQEAKRSMPDADAHFFLPFDFSWTMRRIVDTIQPTTLILCEGDFWYHLLHFAKKRNAHIYLVNGKISERSCRRFKIAAPLARRLFSLIDAFCLQSERQRQRFLSLGIPPEKLSVTGNLKCDAPLQKVPFAALLAFRESLGILPSDRILVVGSTHASEEEQLLAALDLALHKFPPLKVLLVPRHPERFDEVAHLLQERGILFSRLSDKKPSDTRIVLIDAMGKLNTCYQLADVALVAGSFVPHVGGHNIFEPIFFHVPVLFGPHMHSQLDFEELALSAHAGKKVSLQNLSRELLDLLENPTTHHAYATACQALSQSVLGAADRTFSHLFPSL